VRNFEVDPEHRVPQLVRGWRHGDVHATENVGRTSGAVNAHGGLVGFRADRRGLWGPRVPARAHTAGQPMPTSGSESSVEGGPAPRVGRLAVRGGADSDGVDANVAVEGTLRSAATRELNSGRVQRAPANAKVACRPSAKVVLTAP